MSATETGAIAVDSIIDQAAAALAEQLKENLHSLILYGSAVRGDLVATASDVNFLLVLQASTSASHRVIRAVVQCFPRLNPFIVELSGMPRAVRVFALKFLSIRRDYRLLRGVDPLVDLQVPRDLAAERRWSTILSSTSMRTASFTLTPDADAGLRARAVMDPVSRRAVLVLEKFRAPGGKSYELWALHGNTPVALGRIQTDARGNAVLRIQDVGDPADLSAFAISLEPDVGSGASPAPAVGAAAPGAAREPTGPIVMIGSLGR